MNAFFVAWINGEIRIETSRETMSVGFLGRFFFWEVVMGSRLRMGVLSVLLVLVVGACGRARAAEPLLAKLDIEASGSLDFYNRYVWRGFTLDRDPVIQPGFSLSSKGFTFSFWSSWDADANDPANSDEMDFVFDYTHTLGDFDLSIGHTYYDFPGIAAYSKEFYVGVATEKVPFLEWPISLGVTYYRDYGDQNHGGGLGNYVETSLGYSTVILEDPEITMDLGVACGINDKLFIAGDGGQTTLSLGFGVPLTENLSIAPNINYTMPYGDLSDPGDGDQDDVFWGGFSLSYAF